MFQSRTATSPSADFRVSAKMIRPWVRRLGILVIGPVFVAGAWLLMTGESYGIVIMLVSGMSLIPAIAAEIRALRGRKAAQGR